MRNILVSDRIKEIICMMQFYRKISSSQNAKTILIFVILLKGLIRVF